MTHNKNVSVIHVASVSAAGHGFLAIVAVWLFWMLLVAAAPLRHNEALAGNREGMLFAIAMAVPLGFAVIGFLCGALGATIHNVFVNQCVLKEERDLAVEVASRASDRSNAPAVSAA